MKKRLFLIFLFFIFIAGGLYFYINNVFLPVKLKSIIEERAQTFLKRKVTVGKIHFEPIKGFIIEGVEIKETSGELFMRLEEVSFNILLAPILKNKNVIIPSITLYHPTINIVRYPENKWNFSDLIAAPPAEPDPKNPYKVLLRKIAIHDGEFAFTDQTLNAPFKETFNDTSVEAVLSLDKEIKFSLSTQTSASNSQLNVTGAFDPLTQGVKAFIKLSNIALAGYLANYLPMVKLDQGAISYADLELNYSPAAVGIKGNLTIDQAVYHLNEAQTFQGNINITKADLTFKENVLSGQATLTAPKAHVKISDSQDWQGDINLNVTSINYSPAKIGLNAELDAPAFIINLGKGQTISGSLKAPNMFLNIADNTTNISSPLALDNVVLENAPTQKAQATNIAINKLMVEISDKNTDIFNDLLITGIKLTWDGMESSADELKTDKFHTVVNEKISINAAAELKNLLVAQSGQFTFSDNPKIDINLLLDPATSTTDLLAALTLVDGAASGLPEVNNISKINGKLNITLDEIKTDKLSFQIDGLDLGASGKISNLADPVADISITAPNIDLEKAYTFAQKYLKEYNIRPSGKADLNASIKGQLKNLGTAEISAFATFKEAAITGTVLPDAISNLSGEVNYSTDRVTWNKLKGTYLGQSYSLDGRLNDFSRPKIYTRISGEGIDIETDINLLHSAFQLITFKGKYFNSTFDLKGDVHLKEAPDVDIRGTFALSLNDLSKISPEIKKHIDTYKLDGIVSGDGLFKGSPADQKNWQISLTATIPRLSAMGYALDNASIKVEQRDQHISKLDISGLLYEGRTTLTSSVDLIDEKMPMTVDLFIEKLNLDTFRKAVNMADKLFAGEFSLLTKGVIPLKNYKEMDGSGSLVIANGYIWKLIPQFNDVEFTDAQAAFKIGKGKITTDDARMISRSVILRGQGWIDFDKNYDFNITPDQVNAPMIDAGDFNIDPSILVRQIVNIECKGNFSSGKPNCSGTPGLIKTPAKILEGVGGILQGILQ